MGDIELAPVFIFFSVFRRVSFRTAWAVHLKACPTLRKASVWLLLTAPHPWPFLQRTDAEAPHISILPCLDGIASAKIQRVSVFGGNARWPRRSRPRNSQ